MFWAAFDSNPPSVARFVAFPQLFFHAETQGEMAVAMAVAATPRTAGAAAPQRRHLAPGALVFFRHLRVSGPTHINRAFSLRKSDWLILSGFLNPYDLVVIRALLQGRRVSQ